MKTVGALLIAGTAGSAVVLSLATQWWLAVRHRCQHKVAVPRALRVAGGAAATGRCGP